MKQPVGHTFHIPVMGLGFTIDTPLKVARFGISSVMSIVEDELIEQMRSYYAPKAGLPYQPIHNSEHDYRAKRIKAYLNLINQLVEAQMETLLQQDFEPNTDLTTYFELLPNKATLKIAYQQMLGCTNDDEKLLLQQELKKQVKAGSIDVNIMAKIDKTNYDADGNPLPKEYCDALAALRGFAESDLSSSVVLSAGYNPQLYAYVENFKDFYPNENGEIKKKIVIKVSDYRSALTQGKLFAKRGIWVSEFRIESGLNCGGHAFATDGLLLGPIMEEFKQQKTTLTNELFTMCNNALAAKNLPTFAQLPSLRITVQGGIGTATEDAMLLNYYEVDGTGWGSPFLLVPEVTNVDGYTLQQLSQAKKEDFYLSNASPLGVPFNNFRQSSSETQRNQRILNNKPGSPCTKKNLISNCEFSSTPICTASIKYQNLKIKQLKDENLTEEQMEVALMQVTDKDCLCEGLSTSALLINNINPASKSKAVAICPGPNLAYFSGIFTFKQMVDHIYGRLNLLNSVHRSHVFINELHLYVDYLKNELAKYVDQTNNQKVKYFQKFKTNLLSGIAYYQHFFSNVANSAEQSIDELMTELKQLESKLMNLQVEVPVLA